MHCMKNLKQETTEMCVGDVEKYFNFVLTNKWGYINNKAPDVTIEVVYQLYLVKHYLLSGKNVEMKSMNDRATG